MEDLNGKIELLQSYVINYGGKVLMAIIVLVIGLWIVKRISKGIKKVLGMRHVDPTLQPFLLSLITITLKTLLVISVIGMVGVPMTSFIAILGAAGLAIGMALSGTLQNFAGGVILLIFKPFKVGDVIEAQGYIGVVKEIQIFVTLLTTADNKLIFIPNGGLSTGSLTNYSAQEKRRIDIIVGIDYNDDIDKAREICLAVANRNEIIDKDPAPFVGVSSLADSSVNILVRVWCDTVAYWDVTFYLNEELKKAFDKQGITIPFPQQTVHIVNN
ncbi:MAG: mechanosensitive ion channel [Marinilabiliaceae bacterium]|nr:mechanosensitive ion channel [Marinilabiliaceae bacterium]